MADTAELALEADPHAIVGHRGPREERCATLRTAIVVVVLVVAHRHIVNLVRPVVPAAHRVHELVALDDLAHLLREVDLGRVALLAPALVVDHERRHGREARVRAEEDVKLPLKLGLLVRVHSRDVERGHVLHEQ